MYCSACGSQIVPSLSYCNRCGASLKDRPDPPQTKNIAAFLTAITIIGVGGLGMMLGGAIALRESGLGGEIIGPYMFMTLAFTLVVEIYLCRMLSRIGFRSETGGQARAIASHMPNLLPNVQQRVLPEPIPSVTENTTRTLQYQERPDAAAHERGSYGK
jgi:hypothetical protein